MISQFKSADLITAYKMIEPKQTVLIATKGATEGLYNITPYAWCMPIDYDPVTKVILSSDPKHQTAINIKRTRRFAVCVPTDLNDPIIEQCGSVSAPDADKFAQFSIHGEPADKIDVKIPVDNVSAWIECELVCCIPEGSVELFIGKAVAAFQR